MVSHILKCFHRFLGTEDHEEYNEHKDFNIVPNEVVYETMVFLHNICWAEIQDSSLIGDQQFSTRISQFLRYKVNQSNLVKEVPIEEEKQFMELSNNSSTIFGMIKRNLDENDDEFDFDSFKIIIDQLINITPSQEKIKEEMTALLKSINIKWLMRINQILELDRKVLSNNMYKDVEKMKKSSHYSLPKIEYHPELEIDDNSYKKVVQFINSKWAEQIKQSFYYYEDDEECISRWMQDMMKDRTSFWFDAIKYQEIRCDYKEVRNNFEDSQKKSRLLPFRLYYL